MLLALAGTGYGWIVLFVIILLVVLEAEDRADAVEEAAVGEDARHEDEEQSELRPQVTTMSRVVVVASSAVPRPLLEETLEPGDELHVVVPAVEQSRLQWLANDDDDARSEADRVGRKIGRAAATDPSSIDIKPEPPGQLVRDAIAEYDPDSIILALRDGEEATWLEGGELSAAPSHIDGIPVTRVRLRG